MEASNVRSSMASLVPVELSWVAVWRLGHLRHVHAAPQFRLIAAPRRAHRGQRQHDRAGNLQPVPARRVLDVVENARARARPCPRLAVRAPVVGLWCSYTRTPHATPKTSRVLLIQVSPQEDQVATQLRIRSELYAKGGMIRVLPAGPFSLKRSEHELRSLSNRRLQGFLRWRFGARPVKHFADWTCAAFVRVKPDQLKEEQPSGP